MHNHHIHLQHLHLDDGLEKRQDAGGQGTVIQYVYKTAAKTFDGPIGGYTTLNPPPSNPTPHAQSQQQGSSNDNSNDNSNQGNSGGNSNQEAQAAQQQAANDAAVSKAGQEAAEKATSSADQAASQQTSQSTSTSQTENNKAATTSKSHTAAGPTSSESSTAGGASPTSSSPSPSASASSAPSGSSGMSGGAKAGIAFGVIFAILLIAAAAFLLYRRKKKQDEKAYQQAHDEKSTPFAGEGLARSQSTVSTRTTATAPRLSLRPVTQFLPDLAGKARAAQNNGGAAMARNQVSERENPFGDHAASQRSQPLSEKSSLPIQQNAAPENPFGNHAEAPAPGNAPGLAPQADAPAPLRVRTPSPEGGVAAGAGAAALAGAAAIAAARKDKREDRPRDLNLEPPSRPITPSAPSPSLSEFSQHSGSPNGPPPTNVHRVQLDFKPSMDDELELKAGALVRLLHEYDDGWALCIRLDRSQQGVAPRTCLSARPVKPRPPPGQARGPGPRGPPGHNGPPRPASPGMRGPGPQRPASPASGRGSPGPQGRQPRGMGPSQGPPRSMSPGPYGGGPQNPRGQNGGKRRSNSASDVQSRRNSPPGPSPMNPMMQRVPMQERAIAHPDRPASPAVGRKPVPGQAM